MKKRILSVLLCLVMVVALLPTVAFASDEAHECWNCGAIYYGDVDDSIFDDTNGVCGIDANQDCFLETHCWECFDVYFGDFCDGCHQCDDCIEDRRSHCSDCGDCFLSEEDQLCGECNRCESCAGFLCPDCGFCEDCASDSGDPLHCLICDACFAVTDRADHDDAKHCVDCCTYCEQCGDSETCTTDDSSVEYCDLCGLCTECCMENRETEGCTMYCVESVDFEYHFCEDCGSCFCDAELCPYCGLCLDCCVDNSGCTAGMCVEHDGYEEHVCPNCGLCSHEVSNDDELCQECGLCADCCADELSSFIDTNCDTCLAFACVEEDGFAEHMEEAHSEMNYSHTHRFYVSMWSMDETHHWHDCFSCSGGKNASGSATATHTYNSQGICKTCGYKSGEPVYFTTQPRDAYAAVSDWQDYDDDTDTAGPTHGENNRVYFRTAAFGKGLTYQWYETYDPDGEGSPLNDDVNRYNLYPYFSGWDTPNLTISVREDACDTKTYFYCVATDENGNTARSRSATVVCFHRYTYAYYKEDLDYEGCDSIYVLHTTPGHPAGSYYEQELPASPGHRWYCCGEHEEDAPTLDKKPSPHHYEEEPFDTVQAAYTKKAAEAGEFTTFYIYRCTDCGHRRYVEKHEHRMTAADPTVVGEEKFTTNYHPTVCEVAGCDKTGTEHHDYTFHIVLWPDSTNYGGVLRECWDCGYIDWDFSQAITNTATGEKTYNYWTRANMLIEVHNGSASRTMAQPGDKITLTPETDGTRVFTGWKVTYEYQPEDTASRKTLTLSLSVTKNTDGTWSCYFPTNFWSAQGVLGGGRLTFTGQYGATCTHTGGTRVVGRYDPVCTYSGYTGDTVCADCGCVLTTGTVIEGYEEHQGTLTLVEGTAVEASCNKRGYTGDYQCSVCGHTFAGERSAFAHNNKVTTGYVAPTCTTEGYTGRTVCNDCGKELSSGKAIPALGHAWDDGKANLGKIYTVTHTCTRCGDTYTYAVRQDTTRNTNVITSLIFTISGYTVGNRVGDIVAIPYSTMYTGDTVYLFEASKLPEDGKTFETANATRVTYKLTPRDSFCLVIVVEPTENNRFADAVSVMPGLGLSATFVKDATLRLVVPSLDGRSETTLDKTASVVVIPLPRPKSAYVQKYAVSVSGSRAETTGAGNYAAGATVTIDAGTKNGYTFTGWTASDPTVTFADSTSSSTTFTMPEKAVTVVANWKSDVETVTNACFTLDSGYALGSKLVDIKISGETTGIKAIGGSGLSYGDGYAITRDEKGREHVKADSVEVFAADTTYYLIIHLIPEDGYSLRWTTKDDILLDGKAADFFQLYTDGDAGAVFKLSTLTKPAPAAPTIKAELDGERHPVVSWDAVENATSYKIFRSTGSGYTQVGEVTTTSWTDLYVADGVTYFYKVKASNSGNDSALSAFTAVRVPHVPAAPVISVTARSGYPVVSWEKVAYASEYVVYRKDPDHSIYLKMATVTGTSWTDTLVERGKVYFYKVKAVNNGVAESPLSAFKGVKVPETVPAPDAPVITVSATSGQPVVSWSAVKNATSYNIYRKAPGESSYSLTGSVTATSYTDEAVVPGSTYYYKVTALNGKAESAMSNWKGVKVPEAEVTPDAPVITVSAASGQPVVSWSAVEHATSYNIYRKAPGESAYTLAGNVTGTSYTDEDVVPGSTYYYKVTAVNGKAESAMSNWKGVKVPEAEVTPDAPVITVSAASGYPVVSWSAVEHATSYNIYRKAPGESAYALAGNVTGTSYTDEDVVSGSTYYYKVTAVNGKTESAVSNWKGVKVPTFETPDAPVISVSAASGCPVVSWDAVENATSYNVYRKAPGESGYTLVGTVTATSYTDKDVASGSTYYYKVTAVNVIAESAVSNWKGVKVP